MDEWETAHDLLPCPAPVYRPNWTNDFHWVNDRRKMQKCVSFDRLPACRLCKAVDLYNRCSSLKPPQLKFLAVGQVASIAHARYDIGFYGRLGIYGTTPDVAVVGRKMAFGVLKSLFTGYYRGHMRKFRHASFLYESIIGHH